jgi:aryl-alcohol dehydrogenase-like predicted oxidoreductase
METTTIANKQVSRIGLGTWAIGGAEWGSVPDDVAVATIRSAADHGINLIDTAPIYGRGHAEEIIGNAMRAHGHRDAFFIATKAGLEWNEHGVFANSTPERLRKDRFDKSALELAVRWVLDRPGISVALWGARRPDQLDAVAGVLGWKLDAASMAEIDRIIAESVSDPVGPEYLTPKVRQL